jgi:hypothetical protein
MSIILGLVLAMLQIPAGAGIRPGISGTIVRQDTGEPLGRATVTLTSEQDSRPLQSVSSGPDGKYSFDDVPAGRYRIAATRNGYVRAEYGDREGNGCGAAVTLAQGQRLENVRVGMIAASAIAGRLLDQDGEPVVSVGVQALRYTYVNGKRTLQAVQTVTTNDLGEYRLFGLVPGRYYVGAAMENTGGQGAARVFLSAVAPPPPLPLPLPGQPVTGGVSVVAPIRPPDSSVIERFVPAFYPGVPDPQSASAVELRPGESFLRADMRLNVVRTRKVRGTLAGVTAGGRQRFSVGLVPRSDLSIGNAAAHNASTSPDGSFELTAVLPGSYFLTATGNDASGRVFGRVAVDVVDRDVEGVAVALLKGTTLTGRITSDDPAAVQRVQTVTLRPLNEGVAGFPNLNLSVQARGGTFQMDGIPPGEYLAGLTFNGPGGMYMAAMRMDSQDVRNGLRLDGQPTAQLEMEVGTRGAVVDGTVVSDQQRPVAGATVVLVPDTFLRQRSTLYKTVTADDDGRFNLNTIAPGDYKVFAWEDVERGAWEDPNFLRNIEARGRSVALRDGASESVQITAIPSNGAIYGQCDGRIR